MPGSVLVILSHPGMIETIVVSEFASIGIGPGSMAWNVTCVPAGSTTAAATDANRSPLVVLAREFAGTPVPAVPWSVAVTRE